MHYTFLLALCPLVSFALASSPATLPYTVVDTGQRAVFDERSELPSARGEGDAWFGQDGSYQSAVPAYRDNGDDTITDANTGLMWMQARGTKLTWADAMAGAATCRLGGYGDWRAPTIKELYSLINFNGSFRQSAAASTPYLDTRYFRVAYGDEAAGERPIDCQDWSATAYVGTTMNGAATIFGVNFADGRIKGYPRDRDGRSRQVARMHVRYVRGNPAYGRNDLVSNGDGTITDRATGLVWCESDSGKGMDWPAALAWVQARNRENHLGHNDWRLPDAKELQSLVDYTRAPDASLPSQRGPAIDRRFKVTRLPDGDYPYFWTSTTHLDGPPNRQGGQAVYIAFGRATGWMQFPPGEGAYRLVDVHGAGAQRSDPKTGDPADYPHGRGPQGDTIRIQNFVRLVRTDRHTGQVDRATTTK